MSEKHTPGRLIGADENGRFNSDHEWSASHESATFAAAAPLWLDGEVAALVVHASNNLALDVVKQRARRLVACWNACESIPTEALEAYPAITGNGIKAIRAVEAQRDELLAALIEARSWIGDGDLADGLAREHWTPQYRAAVDQIDAAIAKVKGTPNA